MLHAKVIRLSCPSCGSPIPMQRFITSLQLRTGTLVGQNKVRQSMLSCMRMSVHFRRARSSLPPSAWDLAPNLRSLDRARYRTRANSAELYIALCASRHTTHSNAEEGCPAAGNGEATQVYVLLCSCEAQCQYAGAGRHLAYAFPPFPRTKILFRHPVSTCVSCPHKSSTCPALFQPRLPTH